MRALCLVLWHRKVGQNIATEMSSSLSESSSYKETGRAQKGGRIEEIKLKCIAASKSQVECCSRLFVPNYLRNILQFHAFEPRVKQHASLVVRGIDCPPSAHFDAFSSFTFIIKFSLHLTQFCGFVMANLGVQI